MRTLLTFLLFVHHMTEKQCYLCNETTSEENGEMIEPTEISKEFGIPTGFACDDCLDEPIENDIPETPIDMSSIKTPEKAAKELHKFLQKLSTSGSVVLYSPEEAARRRDGHGHWTVAWEGGPYEWAKNLTAGWSLYRGEMGAKYTDGAEVIGLDDNNNWSAEPYYSFDIQFIEN